MRAGARGKDRSRCGVRAGVWGKEKSWREVESLNMG